jgi:putative inorganic carbon (HCO3(-)) transporter
VYFTILGRFMRASGSFGQPNPFGGYLGLTLPVAVSLALWAWTALLRSATRSPSALLWVIFYTAAAALIAAGLVASWSRGAWLGAAVGVGIVLVLRSRTAAILSGVALLAVLVALLFGVFNPTLAPAPLVERVQDIPAYFGMTDALNQPVTDANYAVLERLAHWTAAQRMWESAPWLGVGPGNFNTVYPLVRLPRWDIALGHAHNIFLNVLAETGILGLLAYTCLLATTAVFVWRRFRSASRRQDPDARWFAALTIGVLGVLGHLLTHNLVDNLHVQGMVLQLGLWLVLVSLQAGRDSS